MAPHPHTKRTVTFNGVTYKVRSNRIDIPDLDAMNPFAARTWLIQNTYARGTNHHPPKPNLAADPAPAPGDPREQVVRLLAQFPNDWKIDFPALHEHPDFRTLHRTGTWLRAQIIGLADDGVVERTPTGFRNTPTVHASARPYEAQAAT